MARVRGRGNKSTEEKLAHLLRLAGIKGWRRHLSLPGTPDFAFPKQRLVVFVDGCFWHGCPKHATFPATRNAFWLKKFADNKARDRRVNSELRKLGWRVIRLWEHDLKKPHQAAARLSKIIGNNSSFLHVAEPLTGAGPTRIRRFPKGHLDANTHVHKI